MATRGRHHTGHGGPEQTSKNPEQLPGRFPKKVLQQPENSPGENAVYTDPDAPSPMATPRRSQTALPEFLP